MPTAAETNWALNKIFTSVELGGICANKPGYHNTRNKVLANFGPDYSTELPIDKLGPGNVCAAVDLTFRSTYEITLATKRLRDAALDPKDDRTKYIREFIGTTNGTKVDCWIHDDEFLAFRYDGSRDSTHLWHIHISYFRKWAAEAVAGEAIASVINGETYKQWLERKGLPEEEEVDPKLAFNLERYLYALISNFDAEEIYFPDGNRGTINNAIADRFNDLESRVVALEDGVDVDLDALALKIVQKLPTDVGDLTTAEVVAAVKQALREGAD